MSAQPSDDAISRVIEFSGVTPQQAAILLRNNNNAVDRAVEAFFSDEVGSLVENTSNWEPQDNIPFDGDDAKSTGALPAFSRPPSRADRSNAGTGGYINPLDMSDTVAQAKMQADNATGGLQDQEETDMQKAMELSMQQYQENGVTSTQPARNGNDAPYFGPATRTDYDKSQWGMTVASSKEIVEHPDPSKRRRINGQPAFLRPSGDKSYLAALLTIYHAIPLAREALLLPSMRVTSYGYDPTWWSGGSDADSRSISMEMGEYHDTRKANALAEVQCLMAFLDNTHRAYGSVDALKELHAMRAFERVASTSFSVFLEAWRDAVLFQQPEEQLANIFRSEAHKLQDPDTEISKEMFCVEPQVMHRPGQTLVNLLDNTVWDDTGADALEEVWISHAGDVFTIRLWDTNHETDGLQLTAPAIWYPDRYMSALRDQTREMRMQVQQIKKQIYDITTQQRRLESCFAPNRRPIRIKDVLEAAAKASQKVFEDRYAEHTPSPELDAASLASIEPQIRAVLARIDEKVNELDERKDVLQREIDMIELQYTGPGPDPSQPPNMKYYLSGVATKPEIMYTRQRSHDLLGLDDDDDAADPGHSEWNWWRIAWAPASAGAKPAMGPLPQPETLEQISAQTEEMSRLHGEAAKDLQYSITEVSEADVIEAIRTENNSVVLVYASQNAVDFEPGPLPPALRQFVEQDNVNFNRELREETDQGTHDSSHDSGVASSHGTHSVIDANIMDETPDNLVSEPLTSIPTMSNAVAAADREMTPMSIDGGRISSYRGADGQPSPKRPKSSDDVSGGGGACGGAPGGTGDLVYDDNAPPPSYEESFPEMSQVDRSPVEKQQQHEYKNKIGMYADALSERYGNAEGKSGSGRVGQQRDEEDQQGQSVHIERAGGLPR